MVIYFSPLKAAARVIQSIHTTNYLTPKTGRTHAEKKFRTRCDTP